MKPISEVFHGDCMAFMSGLPDGFYDLAVCDPPYGIGETAKRAKERVTKKVNKKWIGRKAPNYGGSDLWDSCPPPPEYFTELKRISKNQIIWGANHFGLMPPSSAWIVWYKKRFDEVNDFSDAELAYTSFKTGCRLFHFPWIGFGAVNAKEQRIHPTQKPVALYEWILRNYAKPGDKILDTHLGSQSSRIAAYKLGFDFWGCEIDKDYIREGNARFEKEIAMPLFDAPKPALQSHLNFDAL